MQIDIINSPAAIVVFVTTIIISLYTEYKNKSLKEKMLLKPWVIINENKWYLIITSSFIHSDIMHLMFNMISYYIFAFTLEYIVGSFNFIVIYFGSMIFADLSTIIKNKTNINYSSLGASGAISGVIFSMILFAPTSKIYFYFAFGIPAWLFGIIYLILCFIAAKKSKDNINHDAHFWGAITGIFLTILLLPEVVNNLIEKLL